MGDFALILSLLAISVAGWFYFSSRARQPKEYEIGAKARELRQLEKAVKSLSEEMKDV